MAVLNGAPSARGSRPGPTAHRSKLSKVPDGGMVTAEFAVVLLAFVVVLAMTLFAAAIAISHVQTQEAARLGARAAARGDSMASVRDTAVRAAPGATIRVERDGVDVLVTVSTSVRIPVVGVPLGPMTVTSQSIAEQEPR